MIDEISRVPFDVKLPVIFAHLVEMQTLAVKEKDWTVVLACSNAITATVLIRTAIDESIDKQYRRPMNKIPELEGAGN